MAKRPTARRSMEQ